MASEELDLNTISEGVPRNEHLWPAEAKEKLFLEVFQGEQKGARTTSFKAASLTNLKQPITEDELEINKEFTSRFVEVSSHMHV